MECEFIFAFRLIESRGGNSSPEVGVEGLVVGNRLEVHVHFAFGGFHPEAWWR